MFRDRRFLRCLRADALISPFAKPRFWHHVFDIPRFRVWHKCNREFEDRSSGDRVVLYLAQWDGWVRIEPFLGFFHQSSKKLCRGREARSHFRHTLPWPSARLTRRCRLVVCLASHLLAASRSEGLCSSFTLRVGRP